MNARLDDRQLRELYDRMLDARSAGARGRCASPEAMLALVRREGPEEERLATLDHVMACGDCAREFELLRAIEDAGVESVANGRAGVELVEGAATPQAGTIPAARPRTSWRRYVPLALAASLVLAVGLGVLWRNRSLGEDGVTRGAATVTLVAPAADVRNDTSGISFVWRPVAGAVRYELELLDAAGGVAFAATTPDTTVSFSDPRRLVPGAEYRWWVRVVDAAGAQRASEMRVLRVRRE